MACARCDERLPPGAKFCPHCGAPVAIEPASERRLVTVVFVDLVSSTKLASHLDPERFREVLAAFHRMVTEEVEWLRGRAESFIGDAVLTVFGVPTSHDDDAVRAIRAALSVVDRAPQLGRELGLPFPMEVHVGINTGLVAVGTAADRGIVIGGEVNIGARLQQAAEPGEVLVGSTTRQLVKDAVEFGEMRMIRPKEFDREIAAWPVIRLAPRSTRSTIPFVDRRRELALLNDTFERVQERRRAHLVTLLGEPGIGKTRVVEEFRDGLGDEVTVLSGRPSQFEEQVTFWPLGQMIRNAVDGGGYVSTEELKDRLLQAAVEWVGAEDADKVAHRLGLTIGLGEDANHENRYHSAEIRRGVLAMLEGLAKTGPVVLVFEDLHAAEPLLLDLIEHLLPDARRLPLLVVCVARWGFLDERPGWAGGLADAVTLWVEPLATEDAVQLAMEAGDLRRHDALRVAEHAGGNPLFIVEITGMLLRDEDVLPPTAAAPTPGLLPPTVQAVIASRIDSLSPAARDLIRKASLFARGAFDASELALVAEPRKDVMAELEDAEFLVPESDGSEGERKDAWRFRSEVLRDVAYESLAKRERQRLHLRLANRLSEPGSAERYPRTIAYHLEQAALAALDLNPRDRSIADRAVDALTLAGDLARRRIEAKSAADHYEHALALSGPEEHWGEREATILSKLGESLYWLGEYERAEHVLERALGVGGDQSDYVRSHASRFLADIALTIRGDADAAAAMFERALEAARKLDDSSVLARTLLMAGWVPFSRDDLEGARRMFDEALAAARLSSDRPDAWSEVRALVSLSSVTSESGDEVDALALAEEGLEIGRASGQEFATATAEEKVALALRHMLRLDESLEHSERAIRTYRELGARWELAGAIGDRGVGYRLAGRLEDAELELREAFSLCRGLKERGLVTWTAAELTKIQILRGDLSAAVATMEDPSSRLAELEPDSSTALLLTQTVLALATEDRDTALERALAAVALESRTRKGWNSEAAQIWWTATVFGEDAVGGAAVVAEARDRLEAHHWSQALLEPELIVGAVPVIRRP
jgi:class 3 adenylate cyclase/tetratricopeptide (TPR) repeat protein